MIRAMTNFFVRLVRRWLPQPFTFAIILSIIVFLMGMGIMHKSPMEMTQYWGKGFFSLYKFTMQMIFVLITGHALANSPIVHKGLKALTGIPKSPVQAVWFIATLAALCSYLSWAFGLIAGALVAKELAKKDYGKKLHYPIIVAAAYSGNLMRGPSSSIPLVIATPKHFLEDIIGIVPVTETLYSSWNIILSLTLLIAIPLLYIFMYPREEKGDLILEVDPNIFADEKPIMAEVPDSPAKKLDNSLILSLLLGIAGSVVIVNHFMTKGFSLTLDIVILIFLTLGIFAYKSPRRYMESINNAIKAAGGIALQFPFYAGIMGMMRTSGLAEWMSNWFVSISTARTFPLYTFLSAGLVNLFVPSGGGQWAVQGPIMVPAGHALGVSSAKVAMALCWGDSWTNQIQPFWALPLLAIANLSVRDIMGYCVMVAILAGIICSAVFLLI